MKVYSIIENRLKTKKTTYVIWWYTSTSPARVRNKASTCEKVIVIFSLRFFAANRSDDTNSDAFEQNGVTTNDT